MRPPPLYAILDAGAAARAGYTLPDLARAVLDGGARLLQVRAKRVPSAAFLDAARQIVALARECGATVIVNDRADVAMAAGAAGVHVGQDDLSPAEVRGLVGQAAVVGISTHTPAQVAAAAVLPVHYLAVGPVFDTGTKEAPDATVGVALVREAAAGPLPVVAIGGITLERAPDVLAAGAVSVAVIADLLATGDPERRTREWVEALGS